ncbi:hypothetical protein F5887DRAFT_976256 [Amanita rubescens]|nr:hypothetical protein F5887DRAFT_982518 [Amanita rubescens]KAF8341851.1 hypothetical protein F5887DRAFT_976256 [Amanita rubescens]
MVLAARFPFLLHSLILLISLSLYDDCFSDNSYYIKRTISQYYTIQPRKGKPSIRFPEGCTRDTATERRSSTTSEGSRRRVSLR